jgi:hypothetical protein
MRQQKQHSPAMTRALMTRTAVKLEALPSGVTMTVTVTVPSPTQTRQQAQRRRRPSLTQIQARQQGQSKVQSHAPKQHARRAL